MPRSQSPTRTRSDPEGQHHKFDLEDFYSAHDELTSEGDVMRTIIAAISDDHHPPDSRNVYFNNMDTMTDGITVRPKSIFYDGARLNDLHPSVRSDLNSLIVPSKGGRKLVAPNLFLKSKPLSRGTQVIVRKARLDGVYNGNEYIFSFVYNVVNSALKIYAHWVTAPATPGGRPDYI